MLTGAHVVANATFLQVQKAGSPDKMIAQVEAICHDADLALLTISDSRLMDLKKGGVGDNMRTGQHTSRTDNYP